MKTESLDTTLMPSAWGSMLDSGCVGYPCRGTSDVSLDREDLVDTELFKEVGWYAVAKGYVVVMEYVVVMGYVLFDVVRCK